MRATPQSTARPIKVDDGATADDLVRIRSVALRTVSDEDLEHLESIVARGTPFTNCSSAEKAAFERPEAEINTAKGSRQRRSPVARGYPG
jgi:hypothetical protein